MKSLGKLPIRSCRAAGFTGLVLVVMLGTGVCRAADVLTPEARLAPLLGIPYRQDGALDEHGVYTLFARPEKRFTSPGLNCSGFVLAAARRLLGKPYPLAEAGRDRLGDSGEQAPLGRDWDFGWDLIMNLSEGFERRLLLPASGGRESLDPALASGNGPRGFPLTAAATWTELERRVRPGFVYLLSFNKTTGKKAAPLLHYHVGLLLRSATGELLLFQTTSQSGKSSCRNLSDPAERQRFRKAFADRGGREKKLLVLEVRLPDS